MKKKKIICVVGRSRSGKDTLAKKLSKEYNIPMMCSYTDRPMRMTETQDVEHHFVSEKQMDRILKTEETLAYTHIVDPITKKKGYRYCTTLSQIKELDSDTVIYIIDPNGVETLKRYQNEFDLSVILIMADENTRRQRAIASGAFDFEDRIQNENKQFINFESNLQNYDICILNNAALDLAYADLINQCKKHVLV